MSDYKKRRRMASTRDSVGVRELKTHAARIVSHVREAHASYVVTHRGEPVGVILPLDAAGEAPRLADTSGTDEAWDAFQRAGRRIERRFRPGVSGVRLLSDMRR